MELKRELKLSDVFTITAGSMISSGLFVIPGIAFARSGPVSLVAYLLAALIALPTMLSAAELATAMPKAGGIYYFVNRSIGYGILWGLFGVSVNCLLSETPKWVCPS